MCILNLKPNLHICIYYYFAFCRRYCIMTAVKCSSLAVSSIFDLFTTFFIRTASRCLTVWAASDLKTKSSPEDSISHGIIFNSDGDFSHPSPIGLVADVNPSSQQPYLELKNIFRFWTTFKFQDPTQRSRYQRNKRKWS